RRKGRATAAPFPQRNAEPGGEGGEAERVGRRVTALAGGVFGAQREPDSVIGRGAGRSAGRRTRPGRSHRRAWPGAFRQPSRSLLPMEVPLAPLRNSAQQRACRISERSKRNFHWKKRSR